MARPQSTPRSYLRPPTHDPGGRRRLARRNRRSRTPTPPRPSRKAPPTMAWAALRDLPNPELISARPAPANGTRRMRSKQNTADTSERVRREGATKGVTLLPPAEPDEHGPPARARTTLPLCRPARIRRAHRPMAAVRRRQPQSPIPQPAIRDLRASYSSIPRRTPGCL